MPAKSKSQQRLFGMVHAYQKGELDNPSKEIKDIAKSISKKDAEDFAETKHKGLPNRVKKNKKNENVIKLTEDALFEIIAESIKRNLNENYTSIGSNYWSDAFADIIFPAMRAIRETMVSYEDNDEENTLNDTEAEAYLALKKAYQALDKLMHI